MHMSRAACASLFRRRALMLSWLHSRTAGWYRTLRESTASTLGAEITVVNETSAEVTTALDPKRWIALVVILFAGFMDLLDATIVNVTIPSILRDLRTGYA